jgi:hypothetical protein|tara:strand:- start:602 stop:856 length:255 start_codon:yes stop_codon:yes gene_type:complete
VILLAHILGKNIMINSRIFRVSKIEITDNRNMNEGKEDREPSYTRTIKITSHDYDDINNTSTYEIDLYGSDDVKNVEDALKIKL